MPKYKVLSPLDYNNKRLEPGKTLELNEDEATPLLAVAAVEPVASKKAAEGAGGEGQ